MKEMEIYIFQLRSAQAKNTEVEKKLKEFQV